MRKMIAALCVTVDGYIEGPKGELDWAQVDDADAWNTLFRMTESVDACVLGRVMYPDYEQYWMDTLANPTGPLSMTGKPPTPSEVRYARWADKTPHYVLSKTMQSAKWKTTRIVREVEDIRQLKSQPGKSIYVVGGATLVSSMMNGGLLDEVRTTICPLVVGGGKLLFKDVKERRSLKLIDERRYKSGAVSLTYAV
jgi:dihydrofolate reductase